jgi:hypothetical protein
MSVYLDRLSVGMVRAVANSLNTDGWGDEWGDEWGGEVSEPVQVVWEPSRLARAPHALVSMKRVSTGGDLPRPQKGQIPTRAVLTVAGDEADARAVSILATGARWRVGVPTGTTDEAFAAAIVDSLTTRGKELFADFSIDGGEITVVPSRVAALHGLLVRGNATLDIEYSHAEVVIGWKRSRVEIQCFVKDRYLHRGAHDFAHQIESALCRSDVTLLLDEYGLGIEDIGTVVDLANFAGPEWQSRAVLDVIVTQQSLTARLVPLATGVAVNLNVDGSNVQLEVEP